MHDIPRLLPLPLIGHKALAVPAVLVRRMETVWGTEIEENPRRYSRKVRNQAEHLKILPALLRLVVLAPGRRPLSVSPLPVKGLAAELGDDDRLVRHHIPAALRRFDRPRRIPAHILVEGDDVQFPGEIILDAELTVLRHVIDIVEGGGVEPSRIDASGE